jgi:hypothetical protein
MTEVSTETGSGRSGSHAVLAHPLTSVIVGFILTGIIGWALTNWYNERQKQNDFARARFENGTTAAQDFARIVYRRYTRASMLYSAFLRDAELNEIRQRKKDYDDAYADWGSSLQSNLFVARKLTGKIEYSALESPVENALVPAFTAVDSCLTKAYDARLRGQAVAPILSACNMTGRLKRTFDLSYDVTEELFQAAARDYARPAGPQEKESGPTSRSGREHG